MNMTTENKKPKFFHEFILKWVEDEIRIWCNHATDPFVAIYVYKYIYPSRSPIDHRIVQSIFSMVNGNNFIFLLFILYA